MKKDYNKNIKTAFDDGYAMMAVPFIKQSYLRLKSFKAYQFHESLKSSNIEGISMDFDKYCYLHTINHFVDKAFVALE